MWNIIIYTYIYILFNINKYINISNHKYITFRFLMIMFLNILYLHGKKFRNQQDIHIVRNDWKQNLKISLKNGNYIKWNNNTQREGRYLYYNPYILMFYVYISPYYWNLQDVQIIKPELQISQQCMPNI